jgi:1-acyl-sn-glycerol-3-phosphate acyltransferase
MNEMANRLYQRLRLVVGWLCQRLYRLEVEGASNIPRTGGCLLAANHESSIDPALVALTTDRPIHFLARAELWQPGLRRLLDSLGAIPVRRGQGDRRAIRRARRLLQAGELVAIFPQGTVLRFRNRRFRRGAARLALTTGAPLVPIRLFGTAAAFSILPPRIGFPKLRVVVGEPLVVERQEPNMEAASRVTADLESAIAALTPAASAGDGAARPRSRSVHGRD